MPPRLNPYGYTLNRPLCSRFHSLSLGSQPSRSLKTKSKPSKRRDPYSSSQERQRYAANLSRQRELKKERDAAFGDPVLGDNTPYIESMINPSLYSTLRHKTDTTSNGDDVVSQKPTDLNFHISPQDFETGLEISKKLSRPVVTSDSSTFDPQKAEEAVEKHQENHQNAEEVVRRILALENGSSKDRTRLNIQRSIETFGRHNTDNVLPPKPSAVVRSPEEQASLKKKRAGPDTGSAEVQVAVLTSKILVLADQLKTTSHKDKRNKRNLRLLVHQRQKMLKYLRRKERGGPRWQNLMETLGLKDASWKGEITLH